MQLRTFADKAPATTINAADLDANFKRLRPLPQDGQTRHYYLNETPDGWSIRVLPEFPSGAGPFFLSFSGGTLYWETNVQTQGSTGSTIPTPPTSGLYVLGSNNGSLTWIATENCVQA